VFRESYGHNPGVDKQYQTRGNVRDDFSAAVKRKLAETVRFECSNPDCQAATIGPGAKKGSTVNVGVAAHITAASPKGPRYNKKLTSRQRKSFGNGIWLCQTCGKAVDSDKSRHTVPELRLWKQRAEQEANFRLGVTKSNSHFKLLPDDQTMYINIRRFQELAQRNHVHVGPCSFKPNMLLLALGGALSSFVIAHERALKTLYPEALPISLIKTASGRQRAVGHLVHFVGYFRSKNAPRLRRDGSVPVIHPSGNLTKDHFAYKKYGPTRLVLPLDSLWFASHSSVGFFRGISRIPIRGLARVHSVKNGDVIASPLWLALPSGPIPNTH
jgi:hypothetical protein